jgi:hypothetical protein
MVECLAAENEKNASPEIVRLLDPAVSFDAAYREINSKRPTPQVTIEAIMYCVRERGEAALKEAANVERLKYCDAAALAEIERRIDKLKRGSQS